MKTLIILVVLGATVFGSIAAPQHPDTDWKHRIVLFQSTKADVERLLGKPVGEYYGVTYKLNDGILYLDYYGFDHCTARYGLAADWNLPEWTVTEIKYLPNELPKLSDLHLDLRKFRKAHESPEVPQLVSYVSNEEGVDYTFSDDGKLNSVRYFPGSRYKTLRCRK